MSSPVQPGGTWESRVSLSWAVTAGSSSTARCSIEQDRRWPWGDGGGDDGADADRGEEEVDVLAGADEAVGGVVGVQHHKLRRADRVWGGGVGRFHRVWFCQSCFI